MSASYTLGKHCAMTYIFSHCFIMHSEWCLSISVNHNLSAPSTTPFLFWIFFFSFPELFFVVKLMDCIEENGRRALSEKSLFREEKVATLHLVFVPLLQPIDSIVILESIFPWFSSYNNSLGFFIFYFSFLLLYFL